MDLSISVGLRFGSKSKTIKMSWMLILGGVRLLELHIADSGATFPLFDIDPRDPNVEIYEYPMSDDSNVKKVEEETGEDGERQDVEPEFESGTEHEVEEEASQNDTEDTGHQAEPEVAH
jgi:hypothetical protein